MAKTPKAPKTPKTPRAPKPKGVTEPPLQAPVKIERDPLTLPNYVPTPDETWAAKCAIAAIKDRGELDMWEALHRGLVRNGQGILAAIQAKREAL